MEKLIRNTNRLIAQHNCVIIPGMGAFLAHNIPASYNAKEQIFMPPHRSLGFNAQVTIDDALLLSEYLADGSITFEEAEAALNSGTATLRDRLSEQGSVRFGELGTFFMNINGAVSFVADKNGIDDPYNFGFDPIAIPLLTECNEKIVIKRNTFRKYIAIAAAVILAFIFVTPISDSAYKPGMQASFTGVVAERRADSPIPVQETAQEEVYEIAPIADTATENIITEDAVKSDTEKKEEYCAVQVPVTETVAVEENEDIKRYSIIVSSSPNAENAQLSIKELNAKHEADYSVVEGGGRHRIAIKSFSSNADAVKALKEIKSIFSDAWILTHQSK